MSRIAILCPGRGSYTKTTRGTIPTHHPQLARAERVRAEYRLPTLKDLDHVHEWSSSLQLSPEHVSPLIWLATMIDADAAMREHEAVCVGGNSMGWYTALAVAGALDFDDGFRLVQEMALLQMEYDGGGQVLYPVVDDAWRPDPARIATVESAIATAPNDVFRSIHLGGYAVLAGTDAGIAHLLDRLPLIEGGSATFPMRLARHGPYHTPLLEPVAERARATLARLAFRRPRVTLIDGTGRRHTPWTADPDELRDYTLGAQITTPFDFSATVRVALREFAPDRICLPGPGNSLGSVAAHVAIMEEWKGIGDRNDFERIQAGDRPIVWSMRR
ncbi:MAG: ACP S-malonyltransferase [Planctomycetota bacterium]|jgi:malonyl CoA-acyl carrier protein transacylase